MAQPLFITLRLTIMLRNPAPDEFCGSGFYLVAVVGALVWGGRDLWLIFAGEHFLFRLFVAYVLLQSLGQPLDQLTFYVHTYAVDRCGTFFGVLLTMVVMATLTRGSLMISAHPRRLHESDVHRQSSVTDASSNAF